MRKTATERRVAYPAVRLVRELELFASVQGVVDVDALVQRLEIDPDLVVIEHVVWCTASALSYEPAREGLTLVPLADAEFDRAVDLGETDTSLPALPRGPSPPARLHRLERTLADALARLARFVHPRL